MKYKQKQKQNQRILNVSETTLIIGADIAKETHVARALDYRGIELGKACVFTNNHQGFQKLITWTRELMQLHQKLEVMLGIEPTGHYWFPLEEFLREEQVRLVIVNPFHVNRTKELDDNSPTKNDYKDAKVIANLIRNGKYTEPQLPKKVYAELRILMNFREKIMVNLGQIERRIQGWLDRFFPEYQNVFKDWSGKASLIVLREFPMPNEIVALGAEAILKRWKQEISRAIGRKRADQLVQTAKQSIGMKSGIKAARIELRALLEQYDLYTQQEQEMMKEVLVLLDEIPGTKEMLTIPGMGVVTLAGFLAEVGDMSGYNHGQQIIRLAGLNLKENSSGKKKGKTSISKRGRARLRGLLFRVIMPMVAKNKEFKALHRYYTTRQQNPLKKKQSLIACCGKLIKVLHTLGTRKIEYNAEDVLGPHHVNQLKQSA